MFLPKIERDFWVREVKKKKKERSRTQKQRAEINKQLPIAKSANCVQPAGDSPFIEPPGGVLGSCPWCP